jgi:type I restriction enzyme S subunit
MNTERLLEHFERINDAADAVPRLRRFVLDLAVQGRLAWHDHGSPTHGRSVKARSFPNTEVWQIPTNWAFVELQQLAGSTGLFIDGDWVESKDQDPNGSIRLTQLADVGVGTFRDRSARFMNEETAARLRCTFLVQGDVLIARMPDPLGRACIFPGDKRQCVTVVDVAILRPELDGCDPTFLVHAINSPLFAKNVAAKAAGTTRSRISRGNLAKLPFPLPPLAEQHRIVAKVDELMAVCDRLEAAQSEREARRDRLVSASLARVINPDSDDANSAATSARFHLDHFARLATRPEHVKQLRQTILNLAVHGRLIAGADNTSRTSLGDVASLQNGYAFKSQWFSKSGIRLLRNTNVSHGLLRWNDCVCLPEKQADEYERFRLVEDDIVVSLDRPFISTGTKVALVKANDLPCLLLQRVGRFSIDKKRLLPTFLFLWLTSPEFENQMNPGRSLGVPHISSKDVEAAQIHLPPLAEQRRIVAKVDELMALCDQLEASLASAATDRARLLEALLHEALAPAA